MQEKDKLYMYLRRANRFHLFFLDCHLQARKKCLETVLLLRRELRLRDTRHEGMCIL